MNVTIRQRPNESVRVVKSLIDQHKIGSKEIDQIVGERLQRRESVYTIDFPRLKEADPDLILTQELCDVCAVDYQEVLEITRSLPRRPKVISLFPRSFSDILEDITRVG
jgi:iron complex transport system substrate-binding protein